MGTTLRGKIEDTDAFSMRQLLNDNTVNSFGDQVFAPGQRPKRENVRTRIPGSLLRQVLGAVGLEGVRQSSANAETVVLQALRDGQSTALGAMPAQLAKRSKRLTIFCARGFDEATIWAQRNEHMMKIIARACIDKVRKHSRFLSEEQKDQLCALVQGCRSAYVRMLSQHNIIQWGRDPAECKEIFVEPQFLENTRAWTLMKSLDDSEPLLAFDRLIDEWLPVALILFLSLRSDCASSCERAKDELEVLAEPYPTAVCLRSNCCGHFIGIMGAEVASRDKLLDRSFQIANIVKHSSYERSWIASAGVYTVASSQFYKVSQATYNELKARSDRFIDRVGRLTLLREHCTAANRHPLNPHPRPKCETEQAILEELEAFKQVTILDPCDTRTIKFLEPAGETMSFLLYEEARLAEDLINKRIVVRDGTTAGLAIFRRYTPLMRRLTNVGRPSKNRWGSNSKASAMVSFGRLTGRIGQQGWVRRWEVREQEQAVRALNEERDDAFTVENTKRLYGSSCSWDDDQFCMDSCYFTAENKPLDSLLRYLEQQDDPKNQGSVIPIIYQFHHPYRNPLEICQREWHDMTCGDGDLVWLLDVFYNDNGRDGDFYDAQAHRVMASVLYLNAGIESKVWSMIDHFPGVAFKALAIKLAAPPGQEADPALVARACNEAYGMPYCDTCNACGVKLQNLAPSPAAFAEGELADSLDEIAPRLSYLTADLERKHKAARDCNPVGVPTPLLAENLAAKAGLRVWSVAHRRLGGTMPTGMTTEKIKEANLNTRRKRAADKRKARKERPTASNQAPLMAYNMFINSEVSNFCRAQPSGADIKAHQPGVRRARSAKTKQRRQHIGRGIAITQKRKELRAQWHSDEVVRIFWHVRAEYEVARRQEQFALRIGDENEPPSKKQALAPEDTIWGLGQADSPCSIDVLLDAVERHHPGVQGEVGSHRHEHQKGVMAAGEHIRTRTPGKYFTTDPRKQNWLPDLPRKRLCWMSTPGYCFAVASLWWPIVRRVSQALDDIMSRYNRWFIIGQVLRLSILDKDGSGDRLDIEGMVGDVRFARPVVQYITPVLGAAPGTLVTDNGGYYASIPSYGFILEAVKAFASHDGTLWCHEFRRRITLQFANSRYEHGRDLKLVDVIQPAQPSDAILDGRAVEVWPTKLKIGRRSRKPAANRALVDDLRESGDAVLKGLADSKTFKEAQAEEFRKYLRYLHGPGYKGGGRGGRGGGGRGGPGGGGRGGRRRGRAGGGRGAGDGADGAGAGVAEG